VGAPERALFLFTYEWVGNNYITYTSQRTCPLPLPHHSSHSFPLPSHLLLEWGWSVKTKLARENNVMLKPFLLFGNTQPWRGDPIHAFKKPPWAIRTCSSPLDWTFVSFLLSHFKPLAARYSAKSCQISLHCHSWPLSNFLSLSTDSGCRPAFALLNTFLTIALVSWSLLGLRSKKYSFILCSLKHTFRVVLSHWARSASNRCCYHVYSSLFAF